MQGNDGKALTLLISMFYQQFDRPKIPCLKSSHEKIGVSLFPVLRSSNGFKRNSSISELIHLAFNPSVVTPTAWYGLAKAHYYRGEYAEALEDFQHVWAAYDGYWVNDLNRAYLYADWGKQEEAEKAAAALMKELPDFVVEDAADFYRRLGFQETYIDKMVRALKKAGLPSRGDT